MGRITAGRNERVRLGTGMRRAARTDRNQIEIVDALRAVGCSVQTLAAIGEGCPDLLVGIGHSNLLMEIKDGARVPSARRLTLDQCKWHIEWRGQVAVINSVDEALVLVQEIKGIAV